jgi:hypothetical protein
MTEPDCSAKTAVESADSLTRPEDIQEMFGIKQRAYYNRIKYLAIEAHKDSQGKPYLDEKQVNLLQALHEHINETGKMEGFNNGALVKVTDSNLAQSTENNLAQKTEEIYVEPASPTAQLDINGLMRGAAELKAREIAMPALVKRAIADKMTEEDLPEDLQEKVHLAREAADPKFTPASVADALLNQWRSNRGGN